MVKSNSFLFGGIIQPFVIGVFFSLLSQNLPVTRVVDALMELKSDQVGEKVVEQLYIVDHALSYV